MTTAKAEHAKPVMNVREAAEYLGIGKDALYAAARAGEVPAFKLGNRWRFKRSLLDAWMDQESRRGMTKRGH
jgi:excisionase family DNA binding protein